MRERALVFAIPGAPEQRTGGYLYDRRLAAELTRRGWGVEMLRLPDGFPLADDATLAEAARRFATVPRGRLVLIDGLAYGVLPDLAADLARAYRPIALVHHPLAYETGLVPATAERLIASERAALGHAAAVVVTSSTTRETLVKSFAVRPERVTVAWPGVDRAPLAAGSGGPRVELLAVGAVVPRKGFAALVRALAGVRELPWRLTIVGATTRSAPAVAELRDAIDASGLRERVTVAGELDTAALARAYARADLFVSASAYEGFGMALAEALARGLPIVAVAGGAVGDWLPRAAALLVPPGDTAALREALRRAIGDPACRDGLRHGAIAVRVRLPTWQDTARSVETALLAAREGT